MAFGQAAPPSAGAKVDLGEGVAAVVNGQPITIDQVRQRLANLAFPRWGAAALDELVRIALVEQEAKKRNVEATDQEVQTKIGRLISDQLEGLIKDNGLKSEAELDAALQRQGQSLDAVKERIREELAVGRREDIRATIMAHKMLRGMTTISEQDLRETFDEVYGEKVEARQIVVDSKKKGEDVLKRLREGADFDALVKLESLGPRSRQTGGRMNPFSPGAGPLGKAVANLKEGGYSDVVKTDDGYHILKLVKRIPGRKVTLAEVRPRLEEMVLDRKMGAWIIELMEKSQVKKAF